MPDSLPRFPLYFVLFGSTSQYEGHVIAPDYLFSEIYPVVGFMAHATPPFLFILFSPDLSFWFLGVNRQSDKREVD